jgi:hypothetical protein
MRKITLCGVLSCFVLCIFTVAIAAYDMRTVLGEPRSNTALKPTPGVILVTVQQNERERNYFYTINNEVNTLLGEDVASELRTHGLRGSRVIYKGNGYCTYALFFSQRGRESEIIRYLEAQPWVMRAREDYPLQLLAEPNDLYYQPDATDSSKHWVPYWGRYPNSAHYRACKDSLGNIAWTCCCEDPCDDVKTDWVFQVLDSLHMSDQWYLQRVQANRAWDIEKGNASVRIMIIDSGIDIDHPDLNGHIWDNSNADPKGDANGDGLPGGGWGFANPIINKDIDGDGLELYGDDGECDCGNDGDYGFGPNAMDDYPPGPGGGDDDPGGGGNDPWRDNLCGPGNETNPLDTLFNDDMEDVRFMRDDDDANGYPDDTYGVNLYDFIDDYGPGGIPDGLPGVKGWGTDDIDKDGGKHFDDPQVKMADFDEDGVPLCGPDSTCDAGDDGDYGFGPNGEDDYPQGPGGKDDDLGPAWADNRRAPNDFDDDMQDVRFLRFDDEEDGNPFGRPRDDSCPKAYACHGTEMAGIIGAETDNEQGIAGFVWNCTLIPAKIAIGFPEYEYNYPDTISHWNPQEAVERLMLALDYAIEKHVDVVNMSLGCEYTGSGNNPLYDPELQAKINEAHNAGIIIVAAAGNKDMLYYVYPASFENVISVSGVNWHEKRATYVTYNDKVDVCAPVGDRAADRNIYLEMDDRGADCTATAYYNNPAGIFDDPDSLNVHGYATTALQTSGAAAQVSGLAALLVSFYPRSKYQEMFPDSIAASSYANFIEREIKRGCVALPNDSFYTNGWLGAGRIDAFRSLTQWGTIAENAIWTDSVYVSGDLKIAAGKTLTIKPGTTVYIAPDDNENMYDPTMIEFRVDGTLIAEGTESNPIEFKSWTENPQPGDWAGIQVFGGTASASLAYCNISDAYHGIKSYRPTQLSHCTISNCEVYGVFLEGNGANGSELAYCTINGNGGDGVLVDSTNSILIDHCVLNNNFDGIWLTQASNCSIETSLMKSNSQNGVKAGNSDCTYEWCTVESNGQQGVYLEQSAGTISNTRIWKNTANGLYCYGSSSTPEVDHSKIDQNAAGVKAASGGCPILGDIALGLGQYNSIYNQTTYVYGSPLYWIMAENCWWGNGPGEMPSPKKFKGLVDFNPMLESDPVQYLAPLAPKLPTILSLSQNFPNPSFGSGTTKIMYSIPVDHANQRVSLTIYDVNGRRIKTLVDGAKAAGKYQTYWDGRGEKGQNVAPGIYFYKLTVGKKSIAKKLILVR